MCSLFDYSIWYTMPTDNLVFFLLCFFFQPTTFCPSFSFPLTFKVTRVKTSFPFHRLLLLLPPFGKPTRNLRCVVWPLKSIMAWPTTVFINPSRNHIYTLCTCMSTSYTHKSTRHFIYIKTYHRRNCTVNG